ncbi:MAG: cytochrome c biogenesis protein CcsA [Thermodesulfovibrionales bacterium]|nr:cytochrome c biogenesis protein CcsA [Thermodesulfovibrionales bacterium]
MMQIMAFAAFPLYLFGAAWRPLLYAGFAVQVAYLTARGIGLGRLPLVGVHDTLNFLSASLIAFSFPLMAEMKDKKQFYFMLSLLAAAFTAFAFVSKPHAMPLPPVLKTYWFEFHVILSFFSYALFGIAAVLGIIYLKAGRPEEAVPLERIQYKTVLIGYCLFSLSMIFGGVWAYLAWGTYWLWTPKELWTTILWIFYSFYLHARLRQAWAGRPSVMLGIAGFAVVLFTYLGVGLLMKSSHTF